MLPTPSLSGPVEGYQEKKHEKGSRPPAVQAFVLAEENTMEEAMEEFAGLVKVMRSWPLLFSLTDCQTVDQVNKARQGLPS